MRFPVDQPYQITQGFSSAHLGIDIAPPGAGRQALSPENSVVYMLGNNPALEGQYIILRGDSGVYYYFGHFAQQLVSKGQRLAEGQAIGIMGMTGEATGIHTHHEVRPNQPGPGTQIDPIAYYKSKGEPMSAVNDGDTSNYYQALFDRLPDQTEYDKNHNKEWNNPDPKLRAPLYDDMISRGRYLTEENKRLQKIVDGIGTQPTVLNPGNYLVE